MSKSKYDGSKKEASKFTKLSNKFEAIRLDVNNNNEYELSGYGCCCKGVADIRVPADDGDKGVKAGQIWDQQSYSFLNQNYDIEKHTCVNPSLWTNGRNNQINGLFTVLEKKIYQVRGYDMANITFVRTKGDTDDSGVFQPAGWLVLDTLMSKECTYAAMAVADQYFIEKFGEAYSLVNGIRGIIISHSHVDHFGGVNAVIYYNNGIKSVAGEDPKKPELLDHSSYEIFVPSGFVQHSVSENVYAGNAMARRASYQYGNSIKPAAGDDISIKTKGSISIGIGQGQSLGTASFCGDVTEITVNGLITINGLDVEFQLTPGTEAPAEMNNFILEYEALWLAENCSGTLHNLYTLRGAQVRDGNAWAKYLMETAEMYGGGAQVIFQAHNWPHWAQKAIEENEIKTSDNKSMPATNIKEFIIDTASIYKYINDQSLLYMNEGYKMEEVAQKIRIPESLARNWCLRPYYGTPYHDSKAVYQKYLGFYDANPVHLKPLSAEESSRKYIEYMGGVQNILDKAYADYQKGNYRFVAEVMNLILFSGNKDSVIDRDNSNVTAFDAARYLCADAFEQLGYATESGIWRNAYLSGAYELRNGKGRVAAKSSSDLVASMDGAMLLDYMGILFDGDKGSKYKFSFTMEIIDGNKNEVFMIELRHGALVYYRNDQAVADFAITKNKLLYFISKIADPDYCTLESDLKDCIIEGAKPIDECADYMNTIISNMTNLQTDRYKFFDIVLPRNSEVQVNISKNNAGQDEKYETVKCNLRDKAANCAGMFEAYYESMKNKIKSDEVVTLDNTDRERWMDTTGEDGTIKYGFYSILVGQTAVLEDGNFFTQIPVEGSKLNNEGIGPDCEFIKYEYAHILYECYKFLAEEYLSGAECDDEETVYIKQAITLVDPYVILFRRRKDGAYNTDVLEFEGSDMAAWKYLHPKLKAMGIPDGEFFQTDKKGIFMGVGTDGKFTGRELLHFAYQLYKYLYGKKNDPIVVEKQKEVTNLSKIEEKQKN